MWSLDLHDLDVIYWHVWSACFLIDTIIQSTYKSIDQRRSCWSSVKFTFRTYFIINTFVTLYTFRIYFLVYIKYVQIVYFIPLKHTKCTYILFQMEENDKENSQEVATISDSKNNRLFLIVLHILVYSTVILFSPMKKLLILYLFFPPKTRSKRRFFTKFLFINSPRKN